ncbi:Transcription factor like [Quillaja saponaria]|uniref:Transcription factor like n=1 Tax=Quillaja saponaria TaxID=32244 RepID=A0AAD7LYH0_QUISA|nr:Transcription factor like [Quillaja saponaria]
MESGLPMLNCLLQHTLRSLCLFSDSSNSSKWVYAVFWRILPRNFPPPKWEFGGTALDRSKGNRRNWILVWEDGFCDFHECEQAGSGYLNGRFGADVFFKMSHEVYNYGEGLVGKVAADNSHKWVFSDTPNETDPSLNSSWNVSIEPQPRAWQVQFNSGIQTIAVISVREGIVQLGSFDKIVEDLNSVISIQRKFGYLQSIPGVFASERPCMPVQHSYLKPTFQSMENHETAFSMFDMSQVTGVKRLFEDTPYESPIKSINMGWNSPQNGMAGQPLWSISPLFPTMSCSLGTLAYKLPSAVPFSNSIDTSNTAMLTNNMTSTGQRVKVEESRVIANDGAEKGKVDSLDTNMELQDGVAVELVFRPLGESGSDFNVN